jgi:hypothetical protein
MSNKKQPPFTVALMMGEGSSSPFVARILMTPPSLRNMTLAPDNIRRFDDVYQFIVMHLIELRSTKSELETLWRLHVERVATGHAAYFEKAIHVNEPIDHPLNKHIRTLILDAARLAKRMQELTRLFGIDIGFLFQDLRAFERGSKHLDESDSALAIYSRDSRPWLEALQRERVAREHETFVMPRLRYEVTDGGSVRVVEPMFQHLPLIEFFTKLLSDVTKFVEDITIWCMAQNLPGGVIVAEIRRADRDPNKPERFKMTVGGFGDERWIIRYSERTFEDV